MVFRTFEFGETFMKKLLLLINPSSRSGAHFYEDAEAFLKKAGHQILNSKEELEDFDCEKIILKYKDQIDLVVVGGGDGSVNAALSGLVKTKMPLVLIPLGTANNMARTLGIPTALEQALSLIDTGRIKKIDLGLINDIFFVNVAGLGLSTDVNRKVPAELKKKLGVFAFVWTAFRLASEMTPFHATITCDGKKTISRSWQISVCNGKHYGSGLVIEEDATLTDGKLDCLSTEVKKWWHGFLLIPAIIRGKYDPSHDVTLLQGQTLKIETRKHMKIDVDGDIKTQTPAEFSVLEKALDVYVPALNK